MFFTTRPSAPSRTPRFPDALEPTTVAATTPQPPARLTSSPTAVRAACPHCGEQHDFVGVHTHTTQATHVTWIAGIPRPRAARVTAADSRAYDHACCTSCGSTVWANPATTLRADDHAAARAALLAAPLSPAARALLLGDLDGRARATTAR